MKPAFSLSLIPLAAVMSPVYAADFMSAQAAQQLFFPKADQFVAKEWPLTDAIKDEVKSLAGVSVRYDTQQAVAAMQGEQQLGWVIVDNVIGKHEFITYAVALTMDGKVQGIEILSYRETHGGQIRNPEWRLRFVGKTVQDKFKLNQDIPNISGATLSCRNVTDGVKRLLAVQQLLFPAHS